MDHTYVYTYTYTYNCTYIYSYSNSYSFLRVYLVLCWILKTATVFSINIVESMNILFSQN